MRVFAVELGARELGARELGAREVGASSTASLASPAGAGSASSSNATRTLGPAARDDARARSIASAVLPGSSVLNHVVSIASPLRQRMQSVASS